MVRYVEPTPDGKFIISISEDKTARMWHLASGREVHRFASDSDYASITISPDGNYLASAGHDGRIVIMDIPKFNADGTKQR